jgi:N-acetylmuramoyl-L-alanine amidase
VRNVKYLVIHCTATPQKTTVESIQNYWRTKLKWISPGYHYIIEANGNVNHLQPLEKPSNGVAGYNSVSINIAYIGGIDKNGFPSDNRTEKQIEQMIIILKKLVKIYPDVIIQGHRDFPNVKKDCPCFDVKKWIYGLGI